MIVCILLKYMCLLDGLTVGASVWYTDGMNIIKKLHIEERIDYIRALFSRIGIVDARLNAWVSAKEGRGVVYKSTYSDNAGWIGVVVLVDDGEAIAYDTYVVDVPFLSRFYAMSALNVTPNKLSSTVRVLNEADNDLAEKEPSYFARKGGELLDAVLGV